MGPEYLWECTRVGGFRSVTGKTWRSCVIDNSIWMTRKSQEVNSTESTNFKHHHTTLAALYAVAESCVYIHASCTLAVSQ
jgi:hypothetical protein